LKKVFAYCLQPGARQSWNPFFFLLSFTANTANHMYIYHIDITMNTSSTIYITIPSILSPPAKDLSQ
jgi:hypothetical protein